VWREHRQWRAHQQWRRLICGKEIDPAGAAADPPLPPPDSADGAPPMARPGTTVVADPG
jgi:hypothetical protein